MRIAFIPLVFLPKYTGGGEIWISGLARELHSRGHEVSVLTAEDSAYLAPEDVPGMTIRDDEWAGLPVRRLYYDKVRTGRPGPWYDTTNPRVADAVTSFLQDKRPDVVHLTCGQHLSVSPVLAAKSLGLPVVLTLIGFWYICPLTTLLRPDYSLCDGRKTGIECLGCLTARSRAARVLHRLPKGLQKAVSEANLRVWMAARLSAPLQIVKAVDERNRMFADSLRVVDRVLAPSTALRERFVRSRIVEADRITYWPYGIEAGYAALGSDKTASESLRLGYTGHMLRQKGVDVLIMAVRGLPADLPVRLRLHGSLDKDPEYGKELVALADEDPRIQFLGRFDNRRIGEVLSEIDAVVAPSIWMENSPIAIHEALAAHTPVIATNLGGMTDLVQHEVNGLLFERGNVTDLRQQIRRLADEPGLLARLRAGARSVRTVESEAAALVELYKGLARPTSETNASRR
jgi:glycosyltransferase involved in cell wall biosynthesis